MFQENAFSASPARTLSLSQPTLDELLLLRLEEHGEQMRHLVPRIDKCVAALRKQNADDNPHIASNLLVDVSGPLEEEIDRIAELLDALTTYRQRRR